VSTVVHAITGLGTGGAEMMLYKLVRSIDQEQFRTVVVSLIDKGKIGNRIEALGVSVHALGLSRGTSPIRALWVFARLISELRPALVQGWMYHANLASSMATAISRTRPPVVWNVRASLDGLDREKRSTAAVIRLGALVSRSTAGIVYNSRVSARQHESLGFLPSRSEVIPNGFDCTEFRPDSEARRSLRAALGVPENALLVGCIGRFHPMKDHAGFLEAARLALHADRRLHFVLAGTGITIANPEIARSIELHKLAGWVHLLGERDDIARITAGFDIACSASAWGEGFPNVLGEAMACAVPCVFTDTGDSGWVVGDCGRQVPTRAPRAMADAILSLAALDAAERQAIGASGRARIQRHFSLEAVARQYANYYRRVSQRQD